MCTSWHVRARRNCCINGVFREIGKTHTSKKASNTRSRTHVLTSIARCCYRSSTHLCLIQPRAKRKVLSALSCITLAFGEGLRRKQKSGRLRVPLLLDSSSQIAALGLRREPYNYLYGSHLPPNKRHKLWSFRLSKTLNRSHFRLADDVVAALRIQQMLLFHFFCAAKFLICECKQ